MKSNQNGLGGAQENVFSASTQPKGEDMVEVPAHCIRILVVDDHPVVRKGLITYFSNRTDFMVVGEAGDGAEAIRKVGELSPDLILMDVEMPLMDGLAATDVIRKRFPGTRVLVLSMHNNPEYVVQGIHMGARGFVLKTAPPEELLKAIDIVLQGEPVFPSEMMSGRRPSDKNPGPCPDSLFEREKEVLIYLAMGYTNREIGELLAISIRTVESHRARLMRKLNIHSIAGLTRYALAKGLIALDPAVAFSSLAGEAARFSNSQGLRP